MQISRETLKIQLEEYEQELRELNSFITELNAMTDKHNTATEHFAEDLAEAEHNVVYYEGEIAEIKKQLRKPWGSHSPGREQIVRVGIISSISFVAGLLLGSSLRRGRKN
jgi:hypothetical protein